MTQLLTRYREDRALRDAAKSVVLSDIDHVRSSLSGKGMATRVADRIGDGAKDVLELAKAQADENRGIVAGLIAVVALWLTRGPILEILGLADDEPVTDTDEETGEETDEIAVERADGANADIDTEHNAPVS